MLDRAVVLVVGDGDLGLAVGAQVRDGAVLAHLGQALGEPVRDVDRQRHELGGVVAGVAEHQALVAGALAVERVVAALGALLDGVVDALGDVRGLLADRHGDAARLAVEALGRRVVADAEDRLARTRSMTSAKPVVVTSPATCTWPVVSMVSTATRLRGSWRSRSSRIASLIWSAILSGWPSVTDSDVNRRFDTNFFLLSLVYRSPAWARACLGARPGPHPEHPTAVEGCRPASRGLALALLTATQDT